MSLASLLGAAAGAYCAGEIVMTPTRYPQLITMAKAGVTAGAGFPCADWLRPNESHRSGLVTSNYRRQILIEEKEEANDA